MKCAVEYFGSCDKQANIVTRFRLSLLLPLLSSSPIASRKRAMQKILFPWSYLCHRKIATSWARNTSNTAPPSCTVLQNSNESFHVIEDVVFLNSSIRMHFARFSNMQHRGEKSIKRNGRKTQTRDEYKANRIEVIFRNKNYWEKII